MRVGKNPMGDWITVLLLLGGGAVALYYFVLRKEYGLAVSTKTALPVGETTATLNGSLTRIGPLNSGARVYFEYGKTESLGTKTTVQTLNAPGSFSAAIPNLSAATKYYFQAFAEGVPKVEVPGVPVETAQGSILSFTTGGAVGPMVSTGIASDITEASAVLNGSLISLGSASSVVCSFEWGDSTNYGHEIAAGTLTSTGPFNATLTGLEPATWYYFRAKAVGAGITAHGADANFRTEGAISVQVFYNETAWYRTVDLYGNVSPWIPWNAGSPPSVPTGYMFEFLPEIFNTTTGSISVLQDVTLTPSRSVTWEFNPFMHNTPLGVASVASFTMYVDAAINYGAYLECSTTYWNDDWTIPILVRGV